MRFAFGGSSGTQPLGQRDGAERQPAGVSTRRRQRSARRAPLTFSDDPNFFLDRVRPMLNRPAFRTLAQRWSTDARADVLARLRARSRRRADASSAADGAESDWKWACSVPPAAAASSRSCRPTSSASSSPSMARSDVGGVADCARHPSRVPRPRQGRQRLRHRPDRRTSTTVVDRATMRKTQQTRRCIGAARPLLPVGRAAGG